jgi:site-specific recombinase XerD
MLLQHALTELLIAKDYSLLAATRRAEVLTEFIAWANAQEPSVTQVEDVTRALIRRYIADLRERPNSRFGGHLSGETQHGRASVVRMFLNFCAREEWLDERVTQHFEMPKKGKKGKKVMPVFTSEHYKRLVRATDDCNL